MKDKAVFTIAYNGPALEDGTMDVRDLAPALMSLGDLIEETNKVINNDRSKIQVRVKADFQVGSFEVCVEIVRTLAEQLSLFAPNVDISNLLAKIGVISTVSGISLLSLYKEIKGRKIKKVKQVDKIQVELYFIDDSKTIIINKDVYNTFINLKVQESVRDVLKPLSTTGVDEFYTFEDKNNKLTRDKAIHIRKDELEYYSPPKHVTDDSLTPINEYTHKGAFRIVTAQFEDGLKWRLTNGDARITATISDKNFLKGINDNSVSIAIEDTLICEIKTTQWEDSAGGLKAENEIIKVIEHKKKPHQLMIPFEENE